jgi:hypothetical protein
LQANKTTGVANAGNASKDCRLNLAVHGARESDANRQAEDGGQQEPWRAREYADGVPRVSCGVSRVLDDHTDEKVGDEAWQRLKKAPRATARHDVHRVVDRVDE